MRGWRSWDEWLQRVAEWLRRVFIAACVGQLVLKSWQGQLLYWFDLLQVFCIGVYLSCEMLKQQLDKANALLADRDRDVQLLVAVIDGSRSPQSGSRSD